MHCTLTAQEKSQISNHSRSKTFCDRKNNVECLQYEGFEVSMEPRKLYQILPDAYAEKHRQIRVIDESGDDYLYPRGCFAVIEPPALIQEAVLAAA